MRFPFTAVIFYQTEQASGHDCAEGELFSFITSRDLMVMHLYLTAESQIFVTLELFSSCFSRGTDQPNVGSSSALQIDDFFPLDILIVTAGNG